MSLNFIWQSFILVLGGFLLLRLSGRKSIAQMSIATTVVMISIGSIIVQPIVEQSTIKTLIAVAIFIGVLMLVEYLELKFNIVEKIMTGKSIVIIQNGQLVPENLRKLRFTVDKLEMQLRTQGISKISDVKTATLEPNGQLGYELMPDKQPLTVGQFKQMLGHLSLQQEQAPEYGNIFNEIIQKEHSLPHSDKLQ